MFDDKLYDRYSNDSWNVESSTLDGSKTMPLSNTALTELRLLSLALRNSDTANGVYLARCHWLDAKFRVVGGLQSLPPESHRSQLEFASFSIFRLLYANGAFTYGPR